MCVLQKSEGHKSALHANTAQTLQDQFAIIPSPDMLLCAQDKVSEANPCVGRLAELMRG